MRRALVCFLVLAFAGVARADDDDRGAKVAVRALRFAEDPPSMVMSGAFTDVFDEELLQKLSSGFATTIVVRVYLYRDGEDQPVWFAAGTWRVVYDLWEEVYEVRIVGPDGERSLREHTRAEALRDATTMEDFVIAPLEQIAVGPHYFAGVVVEANPVSPDLLAEVRRWMTRPQGEQVAGNASFFGSFVSVFVNPKVADADRTLRFRSQDFYRVKATATPAPAATP